MNNDPQFSILMTCPVCGKTHRLILSKAAYRDEYLTIKLGGSVTELLNAGKFAALSDNERAILKTAKCPGCIGYGH